jgi:hypothetical protein
MIAAIYARISVGRRILLALACLLAFAIPASADCAWVVWGPSGESGFVVRAGHKTWNDCEDARRAMQAFMVAILRGGSASRTPWTRAGRRGRSERRGQRRTAHPRFPRGVRVARAAGIV